MNSRERTLCALHHQEPDRVPIDLWLSSGMALKLERALCTTSRQYRDAHDVDLAYIDGPAYIGPPLDRSMEGLEKDIWGVSRRSVRVPANGGAEHYMEVAGSPLALATTVDEIMAYPHWPSPDWFDYSGVERQCAALRAQGRAVVFMGDRLNRIAQLKPAMYLRGWSVFC